MYVNYPKLSFFYGFFKQFFKLIDKNMKLIFFFYHKFPLLNIKYLCNFDSEIELEIKIVKYVIEHTNIEKILGLFYNAVYVYTKNNRPKLY